MCSAFMFGAPTATWHAFDYILTEMWLNGQSYAKHERLRVEQQIEMYGAFSAVASVWIVIIGILFIYSPKLVEEDMEAYREAGKYWKDIAFERDEYLSKISKK